MSLETALGYLEQGDWEKAHVLVQDDTSALGCWAHGIVHLQEGDAGNARYWYQRAQRAFSKVVDAKAEIAALAVAMKGREALAR